MRTISAFLTIGMIFISTCLQARPFIFNIDTIYASADFCDRVEIINYDAEQYLLSAKSKLDSLTYTFNVGGYHFEDFINSKNEYLIIRGKPSLSKDEYREIFVIGVLQGDKWIFNKDQHWGWGCFISSYNTTADVENKKDPLSGKIAFPKKYFKYKTPSITWIDEERESYNSLFNKTFFKIIPLDSIDNRYFDDSIYVKKIVVDSKHIILKFNITQNECTTQDFPYYMKALLVSMGLPYEKILDQSEKATFEEDHGPFMQYMASYSNLTYKVIIYTSFNNARNEHFSSLDLYIK